MRVLLCLALGGIAAGLYACGGGTVTVTTTVTESGSAQAQVYGVVREALKSPERTHVCEDLLTPRFVEENFGDLSKCEQTEQPARGVAVGMFHRKRADPSLVTVVLSAGGSPSWTTGPGWVVGLVKEDGGWKLDSRAYGSEPGG